jgi:tetratricopeptide (TPR) repeat protein
MSVALITLVALLLAVAAFFGWREARDARRRNKRLRDEVRETTRMREQLERRLASLETELESLVLVAHLFNEGQTAYGKGEYDRAAIFYEDALALQPENAKIQVRLARTLINKGLIGRADHLLRTAAKKDPNNADAWRALATSRRYVDRSEAIRYMDTALELDGKSADNWNYLGLLLRDDKRYEEALAAHEEAVRLTPTEPTSHFYMALLLIQLKRFDRASHELYEANAKVQAQRSSGRIRPIWAMTIEWAYHRNIDSPQEETAARAVAEQLIGQCREARNRQAVLSHLVFYVCAKELDPRLDSTLSLFPQDEVVAAMFQAGVVANGSTSP